MAATITDTISSHLEQVAEDLAVYWQYDGQLTGKIGPSKRAEATRYLYRIPVELYMSGTFGKYIADGGDMLAGSGRRETHLTAGFFDSLIAFEITKEQIDLSRTSTQARVNTLSRTLAQAMVVLGGYDNIHLHGDGTGLLTAAASSSPGGTQLVFAAATDGLGVNQVFEGMWVDVWDSTGATKRAGGPYRITAIDWGTKTVTFGASVTGIAGTDRLAVYNADIYGPSTLVSFSSTWPGGGLSNGPGLTGDSFRHGIRYVNDATGANYYLGRQKSSITQLLPSVHNAASASLTYFMGERVKNDIIQRRGPEVLDGMIGVMHMRQKEVLQDLGTNIVRLMGGPQGVKLSDLQPSSKYADTFYYADIPCFISRIQDRARVDFFNPKLWGRVEGHPSQFYDVDGTRLFPLRVASNSHLAAGLEFKVVQKFDWVCHDPGASGYIHSLAFA